MEKAELKQALLKGADVEKDAVTDMRERIRHMEVDQLRSALRQSFILQQIGIRRSLAGNDSGDEGEQKSGANPALDKVRAQKVSDAAAAKQARLIALDKAKAAASDDGDESADIEDGSMNSTSPPKGSISLAAALASKTGASRWLEQARRVRVTWLALAASARVGWLEAAAPEGARLSQSWELLVGL